MNEIKGILETSISKKLSERLSLEEKKYADLSKEDPYGTVVSFRECLNLQMFPPINDGFSMDFLSRILYDTTTLRSIDGALPNFYSNEKFYHDNKGKLFLTFLPIEKFQEKVEESEEELREALESEGIEELVAQHVCEIKSRIDRCNNEWDEGVYAIVGLGYGLSETPNEDKNQTRLIIIGGADKTLPIVRKLQSSTSVAVNELKRIFSRSINSADFQKLWDITPGSDSYRDAWTKLSQVFNKPNQGLQYSRTVSHILGNDYDRFRDGSFDPLKNLESTIMNVSI